jgi:hypothetical protein
MVSCARNASSAVTEFTPLGFMAPEHACRSSTQDRDMVVGYERAEPSEVVAGPLDDCIRGRGLPANSLPCDGTP